MHVIRPFLDLAEAERQQLFAFTARHDPERFPDASAMERGYASAAFEHGLSQFSLWADGRPVGAMGAVIREASLRGEVFITAVALEPGLDEGFAALLERTLACVPNPSGGADAPAALVLRMGISPRHAHLEALAHRHGFAAEYEGLIMRYEATTFDLPEEPSWRVETVNAGNREAYRQVLDEAFRNSPNGATVDEAQITELMAEIRFPDLLGIGWLNGEPVAAYELDLQGDTGWIEALAVLPGCQGRGVGKRMLAAAIQRLEAHAAGEIKLLVMSTNERAVALYRKHGFGNESVTSRWWRLVGNRQPH